MNPRVILLVGQIAAGKTTFSEQLAPRISARVIKTSEMIARLGKETRLAKQEGGDTLDERTRGAWIRDAVRALKPTHARPVIVDAVRARAQILRCREEWPAPGELIVVGVRTNKIEQHIRARNLDIEQSRELVLAMAHPLEKALPMDECDFIYDNSRVTFEQFWPA